MQAFRSIQAVLTLLCGITLILSFFPIWPGMAYLSIAFGSYFALKACWEAVLERVLDVNFLMLFAAIGAVAVGHPEDAAALLFLFSLSSTLEAMAMAKTRSAIEGLIRLRPSKAIRVEATGDREVLVEDLQVGDEVRVLAFEQVPADGTLLTESAKLDESAMTGESVAVDKVTGDGLLAGTQNLENMVLLRVSATVEDSTLQRIVKLVGEAQDNKASGERISQWFGQKYTLFVMLAFAGSWVIRGWLLGGFMLGLYPSLILLVALSPCALVISTPATTLS
ncbi:MAG: HAD-IC family P-type ATPase, partial [Armatimonadetes bacterium]|nr:HAD-IC family P-type ATPase [Armatimonadota bacterium]